MRTHLASTGERLCNPSGSVGIGHVLMQLTNMGERKCTPSESVGAGHAAQKTERKGHLLIKQAK
jgi:hypothetical protein